jgi:very-short-patch-repair endonuclease
MPRQKVPSRIRANARTLRRNMTEAEERLWSQLRAHRLMGLGFRRQLPIGGYIADFACPELHLVVELDGTQHAETERAGEDAVRTRKLGETGWTVIRFWNAEVMRELDAVCEHIVAVARDLGKEF